jgi:Na+/H+-dicarboxylate symporter
MNNLGVIEISKIKHLVDDLTTAYVLSVLIIAILFGILFTVIKKEYHTKIVDFVIYFNTAITGIYAGIIILYSLIMT